MGADERADGLGQLLLQAFWWLDQRRADELESAGVSISAAQALTLTQIPSGGVRPVELARATGVSRQAVHQTLNELQEAGLVQRDRGPTAGSVIVNLTDEGARHAQAVADAEESAEQALARRIGDERLDGLRRALRSDWGAP